MAAVGIVARRTTSESSEEALSCISFSRSVLRASDSMRLTRSWDHMGLRVGLRDCAWDCGIA